jgi:hypothetical protein
MLGFDFDKRAIVLGDTLEHFYRIGATTPVIVERFESLGAKFISYKEAGLPQRLMYNDYKNFGPRLGLPTGRATASALLFCEAATGSRISHCRFAVGG